MTPAALRDRLAALSPDPDRLADAELLGRFADDHDADAFAALVRRHGPVVLAVCRRVLGPGPDAEDAFQAAFLTLARKAASVRGRAALPAWLHRVTLRVARRALGRRRPAEALVVEPGDPADPFADVAWKDVRRVLDEELDRLPEKYRGPVVLCLLDGCTRDEAAGRLRCSLNTLKRRLDAGRELLRSRLLRRGVAPAVLGAAALDPAGLRAAVPPPLLAAAARTADRSATVPPGVASLAAAATAGRLLPAALAAVLVLGAVAGLFALPRPAGPPAAPPAAAADPKAAPNPTDPDVLPPGAVRRFGDDRFRHPGHVVNSAMSPDGRRLAIVSPRQLQIMDAETGRSLRRIRLELETGHFSTPGVAFSPDGKYVAAALTMDFTGVWDVATGELVWKFTERRGYARCAFTPDSRLVLTLGKQTTLRELPSGKEVAVWPRGALQVLNADTKTFGSVEKERESVLVGDTATGTVAHRLAVSTAQDGFENGLALSPDGKRLAVVHDRREVQVWDTASGQKTATFPLDKEAIVKNDPYYTLAFSADGRVLMLGTRASQVYRWDVVDRRELPALHVPWARYVRGMHTSPDGRTLTVTEGNGGVFRWDATTGKRLGPAPGYHSELRLAVPADGRFVLVGDHAGRIDAWDPATGRIVRQLSPPRDRGDAMTALAVSPDGRRIATAEGGRVRVLRADGTGEPVLGSDTDRDPPPVQWVSFTPDGRQVCAGGRWVRVWDAETGRQLWWSSEARAGAASPDGKQLVAARKSELVFTDIETGEVRRTRRVGAALPAGVKAGEIDALGPLAFTPDGQLACAAPDGEVAVFDPAGRELTRFKATERRPAGPHDWRFEIPRYPQVTALAFSADGKWVLTGDGDRLVRVWEAATGKQVLRFDGHLAGVSTVAFLPDGRSAVSAGNDGFAYLWDLRPAAGVAEPPAELWKAAAAAEDAAAGFRAAWALVATTADRRRALAGFLPPAKADFTDAQVKGWVADLASDTFAVREAATKELAVRARLVEPALRAAVKEATDPEVRKRLVGVLNALHAGPTPDELRAARVVRAAEMAGTSEARDLLAAWAGGTPGAALTDDAKAALARLAAR